MKQLSMQLEGQKRPWNFLVADRPKRPRGGGSKLGGSNLRFFFRPFVPSKR